MTGGGGAPRIFHRRQRRGFIVGGGGVGGVRPDKRALKQRTRWAGVFTGFTGVSPVVFAGQQLFRADNVFVRFYKHLLQYTLLKTFAVPSALLTKFAKKFQTKLLASAFDFTKIVHENTFALTLPCFI